MKLWHIFQHGYEEENNCVTGIKTIAEYLVVAGTWNKLVEKLSSMFDRPVTINTKDYSFNGEAGLSGEFKRIDEKQLEDILWNGVEIISPTSPIFAGKV